MHEERLPGGNISAVSRSGDAVLRTAGPWTPTVHRVLRHLRAQGVECVPTPIGMHADGREVLSFLPGVVPEYPLPAWVWREEVLQDAARLLRRLHDALAGFDRADALWRQPVHEPAEVICHNDFAPHNLVFAGGRVTGVIDFDQCSPGPRVWDLAYLATRLVPLTEGGGDGTASWPELLRRTADLLAAYGTAIPVEEVLEVAHRRLLDLAAYSRVQAGELGRPELREHAAHYVAEAAWLRGRVADGRD